MKKDDYEVHGNANSQSLIINTNPVKMGS